VSWTDRDGNPVEVPEPPPAGSHYAEIGAFQGRYYERNAFTRGTSEEAAFLWDALELAPGSLVLDVGCGTGRHTAALRRRGARSIGVDIAHGLLAAGRAGPGYVQADARRLPLVEGCFDAAYSVCQGGFGLGLDGDAVVLAELARTLRPGARLVVTAFSLAFAVRWAAPEDAFDLERGLVWTPADVRGPDGQSRRFDLWTACYSPAQLRAALAGVGFTVDAVFGVEPGGYRRDAPTLAHPELLAVGRRDG
jgi:SAM-dependent methyltransferase